MGLNIALANQNEPARFSGLNDGYLQAELSKATTTYGELFTGGAVGGVASNFTAPVAVVDGAEDLPFCFGNCSYPVNLAAEVRKPVYPNVAASDFCAYLAPNSGHGLNLHYSAGDAYKYIQDFLAGHGLGL